LLQASHAPMERRRTRWSRASDRLLALSPLAVLERGYALVYAETGAGPDAGNLVKDASLLHAGDDLRVRFAKGRARTRVIETEK
jgi:exodeoxyribonuclease VII large subunit